MKKLLIIITTGLLFGNSELKLKTILDEERIDEIQKSDINDKTKYFSVGFATHKSVNLFQFTKDYRISDNLKYFIYTGVPNFIGLGLTSQSNYNENGIILAISYGIDITGYGMGSLSTAYQWRMDKNTSFFSVGVSVWSFSLGGPNPIVIPIPVLSYDFRW